MAQLKEAKLNTESCVPHPFFESKEQQALGITVRVKLICEIDGRYAVTIFELVFNLSSCVSCSCSHRSQFCGRCKHRMDSFSLQLDYDLQNLCSGGSNLASFFLTVVFLPPDHGGVLDFVDPSTQPAAQSNTYALGLRILDLKILHQKFCNGFLQWCLHMFAEAFPNFIVAYGHKYIRDFLYD